MNRKLITYAIEEAGVHIGNFPFLSLCLCLHVQMIVYQCSGKNSLNQLTMQSFSTSNMKKRNKYYRTQANWEWHKIKYSIVLKCSHISRVLIKYIYIINGCMRIYIVWVHVFICTAHIKSFVWVRFESWDVVLYSSIEELTHRERRRGAVKVFFVLVLFSRISHVVWYVFLSKTHYINNSGFLFQYT